MNDDEASITPTLEIKNLKVAAKKRRESMKAKMRETKLNYFDQKSNERILTE